MKKHSDFLFLLGVIAIAASSVPAFAGNPHATPELEPATLAGIATAGYLGLQFFKAQGISRKKDK